MPRERKSAKYWRVGKNTGHTGIPFGDSDAYDPPSHFQDEETGEWSHRCAFVKFGIISSKRCQKTFTRECYSCGNWYCTAHYPMNVHNCSHWKEQEDQEDLEE
jgi:hypothetical protein